jgi:hypothetical protein
VLFGEKLTTQILALVPQRHWTFSIPRVLRGLFERERKLLGLLSQTAYASILKAFQALFENHRNLPAHQARQRKITGGFQHTVIVRHGAHVAERRVKLLAPS